jgi:Uma2 family endonuclease
MRETRTVRPRRWTREEYYRAAELGLFRPEERLELLDGEILEKRSPHKELHAFGVTQAGRTVDDAFGPAHHVRHQLPIILNDASEPEPDVVVVPGVPADYLRSHPRAADVRLLIEVSDTTLHLDRERKQKAYARAGIAEYWILNLPQRQLEVYRDPSGSSYRSVTVLRETESVTPLAAPGAVIGVAVLLPPRVGGRGRVRRCIQASSLRSCADERSER